MQPNHPNRSKKNIIFCKNCVIFVIKWPILTALSAKGENLDFLDFLEKSFITSTTGEIKGKIKH